MVDKKEMTAVEYLKEKMRLTDGCAIECIECPLDARNNGLRQNCEAFQLECPEKAVALVQKWAEEKPVKTFLSDLLEKHPKTPLDPDSTPNMCPHDLGYCKNRDDCPPKPEGGCFGCWSRPLEG